MINNYRIRILRAYIYRGYIPLSILLIYLCVWFTIFRSQPASISPSSFDRFLTSTLCGRLIRYPNSVLTREELARLKGQASSFFSTASTDCSLFKRQPKISDEERTYPLAFALLVHSNINQLDFLLQTMYRQSNFYCIHVDLKSSVALYRAIKDRARCVTNIHVSERRFNVTWGQYSVLEAEHHCQRQLLNQSTHWKYYFNLANSDLPLKSNAELVRILKSYHNQNDITSLPYRSQLRQNKTLSHRELPRSLSLPFYKGEFHVLLSRAAVEYIQTNSRVSDLYNYLNGTGVPDEHYYSKVNRWKETPGFYPYDHDLSQVSFMTRYKVWGDRPERHLCRGGFVRGICIFNYQDLWHLATSPHFFANKIFLQRDKLTAYCMTQYLDVRETMREEEKDFSIVEDDFYQQLPNVRFGKKKF